MPYFTTEELRALPDMSDIERFGSSRLEAAHDWIASIIRRECETSFIVETIEDERVSGGSCALSLNDPYVRSVMAVAVDGVDFGTDEVAAVVVDDGFLYQSSDARWSFGRRNITITYTAGYTTEPPPDLKEAAMRAARHWLLTMDRWSGVDTRATSITNDMGNIALSVASADGRPTGLPEVDATITAWARKVRVPKVS